MNKFCAVFLFISVVSCAIAQEAREARLMRAIGAREGASGTLLLDKAVLDRKTKTVSFPAEINIREGAIEVLVSTRSGRAHESLLLTDMDPFKLQLALILLGFRNGPLLNDTPIPRGAAFDVIVVTSDGREYNVFHWLRDNTDSKPMGDPGCIFIGSNFQDNRCLASIEGNLININSNDSNTILNAAVAGPVANHEFAVITAALPGAKEYAKAMADNKTPEPVKVTVKLVPRKTSVAQIRTKDVLIPSPSAEVIAAELNKVKFSGVNPVSDYSRLEPAIQQRIPAEHPQSALKIIDLKLKLIDGYLKLYENDKDNPFVIKAHTMRGAVARARLLFQ